MLADLLGLIEGRSLLQHPMDLDQVTAEAVVLKPECVELMPGIFLFAKHREGLSHFLRIDLGSEGHGDHHGIPVQSHARLLVEDHDQSGRVGVDFIAGDGPVLHNGDAFEIRRGLFQRIALGLFCCEPDRDFLGIPVSHPIFPL